MSSEERALVSYFETVDAQKGPWKRIILESEDGEGQLYLFSSASSELFERDYWFETMQEAKVCCLEEWGVPLDSWVTMRSAPDFLQNS